MAKNDNERPVPQKAVETLRAANAAIVQWERIAKKARADIEKALGDAETGTVRGEPVVTWTYGETIDGVNADWRKGHKELVEAFSVPVPDALTPEAVKKMVENHPELIESGSLRRRRTFNLVQSADTEEGEDA